MSNNNENKKTRADRIRRVKAGLGKYYANVTMTLAGTSYTPADLQALLQSDVDANDASTVARETWLKTVESAKTKGSQADTVLRAIAARVKAEYGDKQNSGDILAEFGFSPRKRVARTVDDKAAAAALLRATRKARNTMGTRQKAKVKGTVPATDAHGDPAGNTTPGTSHGSNGNATSSGTTVPAANAGTTSSHA